MGSTAATNPAHAPSSEFYDPDEVIPRGSPIMAPRQVILRPSLTPPPSILLSPRVSSLPGSRRKKSTGRPMVRPNGGDRMLLEALDGGRNPDIPAIGAQEALPSDDTDDGGSSVSEESESSTGSFSGAREAETQSAGHDIDEQQEPEDEREMETNIPSSSRTQKAGSVDVFDLKSLAAGALAFTETTTTTTENVNAGPTPPVTDNDVVMPENPQPGPGLAPIAIRHDIPHLEDRAAIAGGPAASYMSPYSENSLCSPRDSNQNVLPRMDLRSPTMVPDGKGELPPIQLNSPRSDANGQTPLPSINEQLGDLRQLHENARDREGNVLHPPCQHSPPATFPRMSMSRHHGSPPISPVDTFRRELPSPRQIVGHPPLAPAPPLSSPTYNSYFQHHGVPRGNDYQSSNHHQGPSSDPGSGSATSIADRMSMDVDGLTSPGVYICPWANCNAAPFQTQYLLNSHANVHSSARPHFCPVKGCPRSEGGKGFKRKNEMIRHGLVHDSPGYVCPFCPDREHKYPRPDNLQRHVRVHHVDKDKEDPLLRDVLAQRPDGPSRGRRRRGALG
ncbi:hypothetical protein GE09DRAFT_104760 [Coniochaeta sp. 2T2.1]|nr:hypothetical protein GE09DRAFT_104760 [Coniochaeta sp. 2T2.1]